MTEFHHILILHGWRLSGKKYERLSRLLEQKGGKVYSPDLPGFGVNNKLKKALTLDDYVSFVKSYLKKNGLSKIVLIGHSFGGRIAIKYTEKYPFHVKFLILTGVPGFMPVSKFKVLFFFLISKLGNVVFSLPFLSSYKDLGRRILYRICGSTDYLKTEGFLRETFKNIIREDLAPSMKKLSVPTFLIWGEKDKTVPVKTAYKMSSIISKSKLYIIPNSTHCLPYEQPEKFIEIL